MNMATQDVQHKKNSPAEDKEKNDNCILYYDHLKMSKSKS